MMSKKHDNPYSEGSNYRTLFAHWRKKQVVTRKDLLAVAAGEKMGEKAAAATVTVLLSPRHPDKVRKNADCRGNASAAGDLYFAEKLSGGKFRLRWREKPLPPKSRKAKKVEATKTKVAKPAKKKTSKTKAPAEVTA